MANTKAAVDDKAVGQIMQNLYEIKFLKIYSIIFLLQIGGLAHAEDSQKSGGYEHQFKSVESRLNDNPDDLDAGSQLRKLCLEFKIIPRCIDSLNRLSNKFPKSKVIRYHAALAYVDMVPGHTLFKQGWYSTRSMNLMTDLLEDNPEDWNAFYIRGLNGIFWPNSFKRLPGAIRDLRRCIEISEAMPARLRKPYQVLAYIALGDALVKGGDVDIALSVYREGAENHKSSKIAKRLSMSREELVIYVKIARDRNKQVNTDISYLIDGGENRL